MIRTQTVVERTQEVQHKVERYYGRTHAWKWLDQKRSVFGDRSAREAIAQGDVALVEDYVRKLGVSSP